MNSIDFGTQTVGPPLSNFAKIHAWGGRGLNPLSPKDLQLPSLHVTFSVLVGWVLVFHPRLPVVTFDTKCLPVALVPEEILITSVRDDMVNSHGFSQLALLHAVNTQRMEIKKDLLRLPPSAVISSPASTRSVVCMKLAVFLTIGTVGQRRTARMFAGFLWFHGHCSALLAYKKPSEIKSPKAMMLI